MREGSSWGYSPRLTACAVSATCSKRGPLRTPSPNPERLCALRAPVNRCAPAARGCARAACAMNFTPCSGQLEAEGVRPHGQYGTGCAAQHLFRDAAEQHVCQPAAAVGADDDELGAQLVGGLGDCLGGGTLACLFLPAQAAAE